MKNYLILGIIVSLAGCASFKYEGQAHNVKLKPGVGGIVALNHNDRTEDRTRAEELMAQNCGVQKVTVTDEGEVVVGQTTKSSGEDSYNAGTQEHKTGKKFLGMDIMSGGEDPSVKKESVTTTTAQKEWHITYRCGNNKYVASSEVK